VLLHADRHADAIPAAAHGPDHAHVLLAFADRHAGEAHRARERALAGRDVAPDRIEQLLLTDRALVVPEQEEQQLEHLGLHRDGLAAPGQLEALGVEHAVGEAEAHRRGILLSRHESARRAPWREAGGRRDLAWLPGPRAAAAR